MDATTLRAMQRGIKDGYRENPETAIVLAHADGVVNMDTLSCDIVSRTVMPGRAGMHRAVGGTGEWACSADLLLESLVACAGVTFAAIATAMSVEVRSARIHATGHWDARGTLGVDREAPVGLTDVSLAFELDSNADANTTARLLELTERYCVIAQTLQHSPEFSMTTMSPVA